MEETEFPTYQVGRASRVPETRFSSVQVLSELIIQHISSLRRRKMLDHYTKDTTQNGVQGR